MKKKKENQITQEVHSQIYRLQLFEFADAVRRSGSDDNGSVVPAPACVFCLWRGRTSEWWLVRTTGWVLRRSFHGFHSEEDLLKGSLQFRGEVEVGRVVFDDTNQKFTPRLLSSRPP